MSRPVTRGPGVIIAGAAETDQVGKLPGHSTLALHVEAAVNALRDAGLSPRDIDGIATVSAPGPVQVAHALGIVGLTYSAANSLAKYGVTVNAVSPGAATRMT
ncbi:MAG TPA: hypothetical protein VJ351_09525, partial [Streptosporangiaceae bacterium]|nr:hypothetical protein [Streptosporangiaceae bacterium]